MSYPVNTLKQQDAKVARTTPHITVSSPGASPILPPSSLVPSAGATPVTTTSGACTAPNANPSSSSISVSSNIISPSTTSTCKVTPIPASDVNRYKRRQAIPQTKDRVLIKPGNKVFEDAIKAFADKLDHDAQTDPNIDITSKTELVIEDIDENTCGYYFVKQDMWCIFWLEHFDAESLFNNIRQVRNMGHIKYTIEAQYWTHCELFPYENRVMPAVLEELKQMIMHAAAVTIMSVTSVAPFDRDELEKMLSLITEIEGSSGKGTVSN
ncbi:hypothetical protein BD769DRAFT_1394004 [Suillus cothurnatus]|nr:hypothetical protein BD769DRAFT_1394004 [Suillus cothurnatus]